MRELTKQQQAILSEGICPTCSEELLNVSTHEKGAKWRCSKCSAWYFSESKTHSTFSLKCEGCNQFFLALVPVGVIFCECPECHTMNNAYKHGN